VFVCSLCTPRPRARSTVISAPPVTAAAPADAPPPLEDLDQEPRLLLIEKNAAGKIEVTFRPHEVTGELIVAQVGTNSPAERAGACVGDRVLALQGAIFEAGGDEDLEHARTVLQHSASSPTIEMIVQTRVRHERLEFGQEFVGGPKTKLGLTFYSFPDDTTVRVTKMVGAAAKSGRFALGDRIVSVNGIRVNHAQTLSDHIAEFCKRSDCVDFEVALGYQAEEGLWYGKEVEGDAAFAESSRDSPSRAIPASPAPARKAKRSFSFGRRPAH